MDELRFQHRLSEDDSLFIVGGYEGHVSSIMIERCNPNIFIFEPSKKWFDFLVEKYIDNPKVKSYNFGFGKDNSTEKLYIHGTGDGSSLFFESDNYETVQIKKFSEFLKENKVENVKMIEFNCEGAEFEIIKELDSENMVGVFEILQVQYHRIDGHESLYNEATNILSKTHRKIWGDFIWECWIRM